MMMTMAPPSAYELGVILPMTITPLIITIILSEHGSSFLEPGEQVSMGSEQARLVSYRAFNGQISADLDAHWVGLGVSV